MQEKLTATWKSAGGRGGHGPERGDWLLLPYVCPSLRILQVRISAPDRYAANTYLYLIFEGREEEKQSKQFQGEEVRVS